MHRWARRLVVLAGLVFFGFLLGAVLNHADADEGDTADQDPDPPGSGSLTGTVTALVSTAEQTVDTQVKQLPVRPPKLTSVASRVVKPAERVVSPPAAKQRQTTTHHVVPKKQHSPPPPARHDPPPRQVADVTIPVRAGPPRITPRPAPAPHWSCPSPGNPVPHDQSGAPTAQPVPVLAACRAVPAAPRESWGWPGSDGVPQHRPARPAVFPD